MGDVRWGKVLGLAAAGGAAVFLMRKSSHGPKWLRLVQRELRPLGMAFIGGVARGLAKRPELSSLADALH